MAVADPSPSAANQGHFYGIAMAGGGERGALPQGGRAAAAVGDTGFLSVTRRDGHLTEIFVLALALLLLIILALSQQTRMQACDTKPGPTGCES